MFRPKSLVLLESFPLHTLHCWQILLKRPYHNASLVLATLHFPFDYFSSFFQPLTFWSLFSSQQPEWKLIIVTPLLSRPVGSSVLSVICKAVPVLPCDSLTSVPDKLLPAHSPLAALSLFPYIHIIDYVTVWTCVVLPFAGNANPQILVCLTPFMCLLSCHLFREAFLELVTNNSSPSPNSTL